MNLLNFKLVFILVSWQIGPHTEKKRKAEGK